MCFRWRASIGMWTGEEEENQRSFGLARLKLLPFGGTFARKRWNGNLTKDRVGVAGAEGGHTTPHRRSCLYNRFRGAWCFYIASKDRPFPSKISKNLGSLPNPFPTKTSNLIRAEFHLSFPYPNRALADWKTIDEWDRNRKKKDKESELN